MKRTAKNLGVSFCVLALAFGWSVAARRGYVTPEVGIALNWFFPPPDLYLPLASAKLAKGERNYEFKISHKYTGRYGVVISILRTMKPFSPQDTSVTRYVTVTLEIEKEGTLLLRRSERSGRQFWGRDREGSEFCVYRFPGDFAAREPVLCRVSVEGGTDFLLDARNDPVVEIRKLPDE